MKDDDTYAEAYIAGWVCSRLDKECVKKLAGKKKIKHKQMNQ